MEDATVSLIIVPVMAVLLSLLLFSSVNYVGSFLLVLVLILANEVYEKGKEYLKKWREQAAESVK